MKRAFHRRALALLWALAFVLGTAGEGFGLRPCPHHLAGADEPHAAEGDGHASHHGGAVRAADVEAGEQVHSGTGEQPEHAQPAPCSCGSACSSTAAFAAAVDARAAAPPPSGLSAAGLAYVDAAAVPLRPPYFLPLAHAPPPNG